MIAFGLGHFRLAPDVFWSLSLQEWRALCDARVPSVFSRRELDSLIARYPD